uniref:AlNc14C52G4079 protein n=1 Tax=Albugo laibachii Nc14 TaxID=890382 RepID=F0WBN5_9STRA|nr:AlNc14C52G4079 [Albugo laibachii Nc14]|eukprot:CCA18562.1 AlNc14C52G4079 [Albugo laibachii Nc14]
MLSILPARRYLTQYNIEYRFQPYSCQNVCINVKVKVGAIPNCKQQQAKDNNNAVLFRPFDTVKDLTNWIHLPPIVSALRRDDRSKNHELRYVTRVRLATSLSIAQRADNVHTYVSCSVVL